jgi:hypothetical protein
MTDNIMLCMSVPTHAGYTLHLPVLMAPAHYTSHSLVFDGFQPAHLSEVSVQPLRIRPVCSPTAVTYRFAPLELATTASMHEQTCSLEGR